jgi:integrase
MRVPTPEQVAAILAACDDRFRVYVAVCAFAGLRRGEASALQAGDVDFLKRRISVARQVQRADGRTVEIRLPKYGSERDVYVPDELLQMLSQLIASGVRGRGCSPVRPTTRRMRARSGLGGGTCAEPRGCRVCTCRICGITSRAASLRRCVTWRPTVQRALGHPKASTTYDTFPICGRPLRTGRGLARRR